MKKFFDNKIKDFNKGFTIIEIIIACTIISVTVLFLMSSAQKGIELSIRALRQTQANTLLEEGAEVVKIIRDNDWANISILNLDTNYYLFFNTDTNTWSLSESITTPNNSLPNYPIDGIFTRTVLLSSVERDGGNDIVSSDGSIDDRTKKVTVVISWPSTKGIIQKELVFYLADIFD
jgi:prepilin-type N-terminal cleavage/methylation domain-containing protein